MAGITACGTPGTVGAFATAPPNQTFTQFSGTPQVFLTDRQLRQAGFRFRGE